MKTICMAVALAGLLSTASTNAFAGGAPGETAGVRLAAGPDTGAPSQAAPSATAKPVGSGAPAQASAPAVAPAASSSDAEASEAFSAAETLPSAIEDVQVVGPWSADGQEGVWRTIMVRSASQPDRYRFFLQQMVVTNGSAGVKATTEIKEIQAMDGAVVGYRADEQDPANPSTLTLFFDIIPTDGEVAETYQLFFTPGQPYEFGPASN